MTDYVIASGQTITGLVLAAADTLVVDPGGTAERPSGSGAVTVSGTLSDPAALSGSVDVVAGGALTGGTLAGASLVVEAGASASGVTLRPASVAAGSAGGDPGNYENDGTASGLVVAAGAQLVNEGTASGTVIDSGAVFDEDGSTDSGMTVRAGGLEEVIGRFEAVSGVSVASGGTLVLVDGGDASGISLAQGAAVDLDDYFHQPSDTASFDASTDVLTVRAGDSRVSLQLAGSYAGERFVLSADTAGGVSVAVEGVACYCPGTAIAVPGGERAVEDLAVGGLVVTASGRHRRIRSVGRRSYAASTVVRERAMWPVVFAAGSLGGDLPRRDLAVSQEHALFLDGLLVPARALVGSPGITRPRPIGPVSYHHVELDDHDVLLAEGVPAESFVDDGSRVLFEGTGAAATAVPAEYCAPRAEDGFAVEAIRRRLADRLPAFNAAAA